MKINHYEFGRIQIDGKDYKSDVIINKVGVQDQWWRKEGHNLAIEDLNTVVEANPDVVVIGTGYYGRMHVPDTTRKYLVDKGILVEVENTTDAVAKFNALQEGNLRIAAALHLTC